MDAALSGPTGRVVLGSTFLKIGRLPENQLVVNDSNVSSRHAEIRPVAAGYILVDLGSSNGTFVNEQRLVPQTPRTLKAGDVIRIGDTSYVYESQGQAEIAPTVYMEPGAVSEGTAYAPTVMAPGQQEFPEYQAFSPVYAPPPKQVPPPAPQGFVPPPSGYLPSQPGTPPVYQPGLAVAVPKKSRRGLWIMLGVVAGVLVLLVAVCAVLLVVNAPTANKALDAFCTNIKNKDGQAASRLFSDDLLKSQGDGVTSFITLVDSGQIPNCTHTPATTSDQSAQAQVILTASNGSNQTDNVRLATDSNGNWKIANLQIAQ